MMSTLVFVAAFCVVAVLVYMARYSGRVRVEQTRLIDAPLADVYARVADFRHWNEWSPWLEHAPGARLTLSQVADAQGSSCAWDGAKTGTGAVEHVKLLAQQRIEQRIHLQHPFTVRGQSVWTFTEREGKTEVRWSLRGRVAFSMRAFSQTVKESIALDLRYGLDRLAHGVEPADAARYSITHLGVRNIEACRYVHRTYDGPIKGLSAALRKNVSELRQQLAELGIQPLGAPVAVYVKTNIKLRTTVCHMGIPIDAASTCLLPVRELAAHRAYVVHLQGNRLALEVAWYHAMQHIVLDNIKPDQRIAPVEHYLVEGHATTGNDDLTELHIPVATALH